MMRWHETNALASRQRLKHVAYMSMEFLIARNLASALASTGLEGECRAALASLGVDLDEIMGLEQDPALGNGGLGRLAACFLEFHGLARGARPPATASALPMGCSGRRSSPAGRSSSPRTGRARPRSGRWCGLAGAIGIRFGGKVHHRGYRAHRVDTEDLYAVAHDLLIAGQGQLTINTLRLWDTEALHPFDLAAFNAGRLSRCLGRAAAGPDADAHSLSRQFDPGRPRAAAQAGAFLRLGLAAGHRRRPDRRQGEPERHAGQGRHPPQRHPSGAGAGRS